MKSNITVKSNIYVNKGRSTLDRDFMRQVRGYEALQQISQAKGKMGGLQFTDAQIKEKEYGPPGCSKDKSGTKAWGLVIENGAPVFVCKCEKRDCQPLGDHAGGSQGIIRWKEHQGYSECSQYENFRKIERSNHNYITDTNDYDAPDFSLLRYLDADDKIRYFKMAEKSTKPYEPPEIIIRPSDEKLSDSMEPSVETSPVPAVDPIVDISFHPVVLEKIAILPPKINPSNMPDYKKIDDPSVIIESQLSDRIIVNAGPGTGKTYSVIQRLGYIMEHNLAYPGNVLVLCYSRSAVGVIKKRINDEIEAGSFPVEARQLFGGIKTFDSFATYMLSDEESKGVINYLKYDERIEKFIVELNKNKTIFEGLEYLIVDEMQDLVGVRARMVKAILEVIKCGFLLLGDMCQSIYDYNIKDKRELNSVRYYEWLNSQFQNEVKRYELTKNVRQKDEIAMFTEYLRDAIIAGEMEKQVEAVDLCFGTLSENNLLNIRDIGGIIDSPSIAYLCRNNAQASIISTEFFARDIAHRISKRPQHIDLAPWLAEILSRYTDNRIGITAFRELAVDKGHKDADNKWEILKAVAPDNNPNVLDLRLLIKTLVSGKELPWEIDLSYVELPTITTIHRAKGREYEQVVLSPENYNRNHTYDEIKVSYVALTRGKEKINFCVIPKYFTSQLNSGRWIASGKSRKNNKRYCSNFDLGLEGDLDPYSFISDTLGDAQLRQSYISKLQPGDMLEAWFIEGKYGLYHQGFLVGMLSNNILFELRDAMNKTNHSPDLPNRMTNIYVNNVVTVANSRILPEIPAPFNKSGLWLGIEISGFAKTAWV